MTLYELVTVGSNQAIDPICLFETPYETRVAATLYMTSMDWWYGQYHQGNVYCTVASRDGWFLAAVVVDGAIQGFLKPVDASQDDHIFLGG
jgi:hypothetical protein